MEFLRRLARLLGLGAATQSPDPLSLLAQRTASHAVREPLVLSESQMLVLSEIVQRSRVEAGPTIVLFNGSRSGKVATAASAAKDLERDLYRVNLAKVVSEYIGETEKNLNQLLKAAERVSAVLFFDEADPLFGKRSEVRTVTTGTLISKSATCCNVSKLTVVSRSWRRITKTLSPGIGNGFISLSISLGRSVIEEEVQS